MRNDAQRTILGNILSYFTLFPYWAFGRAAEAADRRHFQTASAPCFEVEKLMKATPMDSMGVPELA